MPLDLALTFRPELGCADLVWTGAGLGLDATPRSALLASALADRRAKADDPVRLLAHDPAAPASLELRGGSPRDGIDPRGELAGSRLWLLKWAKDTSQAALNGDETRKRGEEYAAECIAWLARRGLVTSATATWLRAGALRVVARAGATQVAVTRQVG